MTERKPKQTNREDDGTETVVKNCFAIMPISDPEGYETGHFQRVYEDIIVPGAKAAGYRSIRADENKATGLIHLGILTQLLKAPIAVCDLSSRNPNVLFELGIRQAFDKPVVLIQEKGTPKIFDINPISYIEYSRELKYREVLKMQEQLEEAITATMSADPAEGNVNSIVKLLALNEAASIPNIEDRRELLEFQVIQSEIRQLRTLIEQSSIQKVVFGSSSTSQFGVRTPELSLGELQERVQAALEIPNERARLSAINLLISEVAHFLSFAKTPSERRILVVSREILDFEKKKISDKINIKGL